jgi:coatomer protein complex subunit epsilon
MDPFSTEGELINLQNHFLQGQWQEVVDYDTSSLSETNALPARILALRAQIALGQAEDVVAEVKGEKTPELLAVGALADYATGNTEGAERIAEKLAATSGDNAVVQVLCGTVLQAQGHTEEALALLSKHQGSREFVG